MNGATWVVRALQKIGVRYVFALCGNGLHSFLASCRDEGLTVIDCHNEQAAAFMADGWGRLTGTLGVVAVSSGPGFTNTITGTANAFWDGSPMLFISGASSELTKGLEHFQEMDQERMVEPICKYAARVTHGEQIPHQFQRAVAAAVQGRPGPVHLTITDNAFADEITSDTYLAKLTPEAGQVNPQGWGDPLSIASAVELIKEAKRPLLIAGSGLFYSHGADALAQFARRTDIPVLTPMWDRGPVEEPLRQYIGITDPEANPAYSFLEQCDLLINVGARFDYRLNYLQDCPQDMKIIHIHHDAAELNRGYISDVAILGSPAVVIKQLAAALSEGPIHSQWLDEIIAFRAQALAKWFSMKDDDRMPMRTARLVLELAPFLEDDKTVFVIDGGNIGRWAQMLLFNRCRGKWITCGTSGVIGHGIPVAMAAKLAFPDHKVLLLTGDGSFGFTPLELWNAYKKKLPFTAVIAADGAWGIVADKQPPHARFATEFGPIPFYALAEALQGKGILIEKPEEIKKAVAAGLADDRVTVIQVPCEQGGIDIITQNLSS